MPPSPLPRVLLTLALSLLPLAPALAGPDAPIPPVPSTALSASPTSAERLTRAISALTSPSIHRQQKAIITLTALGGEKADAALLSQFDRWQSGELPVALWLDLAEAAAKRNTPLLKTRLLQYERSFATAGDPLHRWRECLEGGDADEGRELFFHKLEAGCFRCHKVDGEGAEIGPDLTGLGQRMDRVYILESIIDPNAVISPGFDQALLTLASGEQVSGLIQVETADYLTLVSVTDGKKRQIKTAEITQRTALPSAMPPAFGQVLTKRNLRDLVEFIATSQ